jgi:type III secretion system FlhB-like substrate exporter
MSTDPETRRAIAQGAIDRARARGVPIDTDPAFLDLLEEWIRGDVDMKVMRERYLDMIAFQAAEWQRVRKSRPDISPSESSDEMIEE